MEGKGILIIGILILLVAGFFIFGNTNNAPENNEEQVNYSLEDFRNFLKGGLIPENKTKNVTLEDFREYVKKSKS